MIERDEYIQRCFRAQYPELYKRDAVEEPSVPAGLRHGLGSNYTAHDDTLAPMEQGAPDAIGLIAETLIDAERLRAQLHGAQLHKKSKQSRKGQEIAAVYTSDPSRFG
jgi:hypothetical protein